MEALLFSSGLFSETIILSYKEPFLSFKVDQVVVLNVRSYKTLAGTDSTKTCELVKIITSDFFLENSYLFLLHQPLLVFVFLCHLFNGWSSFRSFMCRLTSGWELGSQAGLTSDHYQLLYIQSGKGVSTLRSSSC